MAELIRRPWTDADDRSLIDLWPRVGSIVLIALALQRSSSSVQTRASRLGLPRRLEGNDRHRRKWTTEDLKNLDKSLDKRIKEDGSIPISVIADDVGRSIDAVAARISDMLGGEAELFSKIIVDKATYMPQENAKTSTGPKKIIDTRKVEKRRPCLKCRKNFWSKGAHNRLCMACKSADTGSDFDW